MVSTAFCPGADVDPSPYDSIIISSNKVYFHVHRQRLLSVSSNSFNFINLPVETEVHVPEHSTVLNVVLHTMYGISCSKYRLSLYLLLSSLSVLEKYGVAVKLFITPETPLFDLILMHIPSQENTIEIYMTAAAHDIFSLAQVVSPHLLSFQLPTLTDDMATRMGPIYLKRLFSLHMIQSRTLLQLTSVPPEGHMPTVNCH
ncbi:hypothetical protein K474DRAFT_1603561 [Panus rudis PR-1116 ss-1]|nr:hypothetical protein K474DRAFT_1603561 [Panus rudis PR-1116 ss-1]